MRTFLISCALLLAMAVSAHGKLLSADSIRAQEPLLPYCTWLPDPGGTLGINDVASGDSRFAPLPDGLPAKAGGPVWIRLLLIRNQPQGSGILAFGGRPRLVMQLGELPQGKTRVYFSESPGLVQAQGYWHSEFITSGEDVLLPEPGFTPVSVYVRMDETPGPWFAPTVSPQPLVTPQVIPFDLILNGLLIAVMAACLLRAIASRSQCGVWAAVYLGTVLLQSVLPLPGAGDGFAVSDLPALLAPGLSLMLLPHVGRCMFRPDRDDNGHDGILYACSALGVIVCLAPLIPGFGWLTRLYPLWALFFIPLLPVSLNARTIGKQGAMAFFTAAALPILGSVLALAALVFDPYLLHPVAAQGALWGAAFGGVALALAGMARPGLRYEGRETGPNALDDLIWDDQEEQRAASAQARQRLDLDLDIMREPAPTAEQESFASFTGGTADEPLVHKHDLAEDLPEGYTPLEPEQTQDVPDAEPLLPWQPATGDDTPKAFSPSQVEAAVQEVLSSYSKGGEPEGGKAPPSRVISLVDEEALAYDPHAVPSAGADFGSGVPQEVLDELAEGRSGKSSPAQSGGFVFNLPALVREVHDIIAPLAKNKALLFSWFTAPSLPVLLEGDAPRLRGALLLLLQNAVQATESGSVGLSVRRTPGSSHDDQDNTADLLFSILDSGSSKRTDAGFFHAWELASRTGGTFTVDYSPEGGTHISFTARFPLPSATDVATHVALYAQEPLADDPLASGMDEEEEPIAVLHAVERPGKVIDQSSATSTDGFSEFASTLSKALGTPQAETQSQPAEAPASPARQGDERHGAPRSLWTGTRAAKARSEGGDIYVLAVQMTSGGRKHIATALEDMPVARLDAPDAGSALAVALATPPALVVFDADTPEPDIINGIRQLQAQERELGYNPMPMLTLTSHEAQSLRMQAAGSDLTLVKPVTSGALRHAVATVVPELAAFDDGDASDGMALGGTYVPPEATPAATVIGGRVFTPQGQNADATVDPFVAYMRVTPELATPTAAHDGHNEGEAAASDTEEQTPEAHSDTEPQVETAEISIASQVFFDELEENFATPVVRGSDDAAQAAPDMEPEQPVVDEIPHTSEPELESAPFIEDEHPVPTESALPPEQELHAEKERQDEQPETSVDLQSIEDVVEPVIGMTEAVVPPVEQPLPDERSAMVHGGEAHSSDTITAATDVEAATVLHTQPQEMETPASKPFVVGDALNVSAGDSGAVISGVDTIPADPFLGPPSAKGAIRGYMSGFSDTISTGFTRPSEPAPAADSLRKPDSQPKQQPAKGKPLIRISSPDAKKPEVADMKSSGKDGVADDAAPGAGMRFSLNMTPKDSGSSGGAVATENQTPVPQESVSEKARSVDPALEQDLGISISMNDRTAATPPTGITTDEPVSEATAEPVQENASVLNDAPPQASAEEIQMFPLQGIDGEMIDSTMLPLLPGLVHFMRDVLAGVKAAAVEGNTLLAQEAAARLASRAEDFGLQKLGKITRCVERAAEADDIEAVNTLLEDLEPIAQRYINALEESFLNFINMER